MNKLRVATLAGGGFLLALTGATSLALSPKPDAAAVGSEIVEMRRLTESQYRHAIADIFGPEVNVQGRFEPPVRSDGLIAIGNSQATITTSGMEQYYAIASGISSQVTGEKLRDDLIPCAPRSPKAPDDQCARQFFETYGQLLFRRPLEDAELTGLVSTAHDAASLSDSFYVGIEETLTSLLTSPHFLFRMERIIPAQGGQPAKLDAYSRASRLSFTFWDAPPDEQLLQSATSGDLLTQAGLQAQISRLASSPRVRDGLAAFFEDMLQFDHFEALTKDASRYPKFSQVLAEEAQEQTIKTILSLLVDENGDYRDIFTTRETFLTRTLAMVYKIPYTTNAAWAPYTFDEDSKRAGVLTHVSFLSLFSHPAQSSPTKRGIALNEVFLCQPIPPPPPDVDFSAVNAMGPERLKTARMRLELHRTNPACSACHSVMDPLGLTLEKFDTLGQYRETEDGAPIDVSSEYAGTHFVGAEGLGKVMHDNPRVSECLVRNLYATAVGRTPAPSEYKLLQAFTEDFSNGGYKVPAFLERLALTDEFYSFQPVATGKE